MKIDILSLNFEEVLAIANELGEPKFRAQQIFEWLHKRHAVSFEEMNNLPLSLRKKLEDKCEIFGLQEIEKLESKKDGTIKFLSKTHDNALIESVLMSYKHGESVCISTQAGCRMGCKFCASAEQGLHRNLSTGEYLAQVYMAYKSSVHGIKGIVLMGCGEPLDNFDATVNFIELITHPTSLNIGARHITLSTCGLVPEIYKLAEKKMQITLAISLHATNNKIREEIMPIAKKYDLNELIKACRFYAKKTNRRLTFEYALTRDINSSREHALELAKLLKGLLCHVNLIPINKARGEFSPASKKETEEFALVLEKNNIPVTIRRSLGGDVNAACGQLRLRHLL